MRLITFGDSWTAGHGVEENKLYKENAMEMRQNSFHRVFYLFIIETKSIKNDTRNARNVFWNDARPALGKGVFEQYNQP